MRDYLRLKAGLQYPTTVSIPIPTEAELYIAMAGIILIIMWMVMDG